MKKQLVLFGDGLSAEVFYEYFQKDSEYEVVGFVTPKEFRKKDTLFDRPVVDFEDINNHFPKSEHSVFISAVFNKLNRLRRQYFINIKEQGYHLASYVSSNAMVWDNVKIGENCFIFENNVIQPFCEIGDNNIFWSGNHFGHHTKLGNHNFLASHVVISGNCRLGDCGFYGVNATLGDGITVENDCFIGAGCLVTRDLKQGSFLRGNFTIPSEVSSYEKFGVEKL